MGTAAPTWGRTPRAPAPKSETTPWSPRPRSREAASKAVRSLASRLQPCRLLRVGDLLAPLRSFAALVAMCKVAERKRPCPSSLAAGSVQREGAYDPIRPFGLSEVIFVAGPQRSDSRPAHVVVFP